MSTSTIQPADMTEPRAARIHLGWLDSLRALAALYVAMSHIISIVNPAINHYHGLTLTLRGRSAMDNPLLGYLLFCPVSAL